MELFVAGLVAGCVLLLVTQQLWPHVGFRWLRTLVAGREPKDLRAANVGGSKLAGKYLFDADLRGVDLTDATIDNAMDSAA